MSLRPPMERQHIGESSSPRLRAHNGVRTAFLLLLVFLVLLSSVLSLAVGSRPIPANELSGSLLEAWQIISQQCDADGISTGSLIAQLRVPRTLVGILVGAALGAAGAIVQGLTRNPIAGPGVLGISAGASFAVVIGLSYLGLASMHSMVFAGFLGSLAAAAIVHSLAVATGAGRGGEESLVGIVLGGAALSAVLLALTSGVLLANLTALDRMRFWTAGSLAGRDMAVALGISPAIGLGLIAALPVAARLNILNLGDAAATALGINPARVRGSALATVAVLAGAAAAAAGPISFVGLVAPHLVRPVSGADHRWTVPYSALGGAALLLFADVLSRIVVRPGELHVGIMLAVIGVPFLLALLTRRRLPEL